MLDHTKTKNKKSQEYKPYFGISKNLKNYGIWAGATAVGLVSQASDTGGLRNVIPEPFDLMDHAGNLAPSMAVGAGATYLAALLGTKFSNSPKIVRRAAIAVGMVAVTAANVLVETKYGLGIYHTVNANTTPDVLDIGYGVAAGSFSSSLVEVVPKDGTSNSEDHSVEDTDFAHPDSVKVHS